MMRLPSLLKVAVTNPADTTGGVTNPVIPAFPGGRSGPRRINPPEGSADAANKEHDKTMKGANAPGAMGGMTPGAWAGHAALSFGPILLAQHLQSSDEEKRRKREIAGLQSQPEPVHTASVALPLTKAAFDLREKAKEVARFPVDLAGGLGHAAAEELGQLNQPITIRLPAPDVRFLP